MQVFVAFLVLAVVLGGAEWARPVRRHPLLLLGVCTVVGASFYSLRVVL